MDAQSGRETPHHANYPIDPDHNRLEVGIEDSEDPDLEAWFAAREFELDEMVWALADRYGDEVGQ
jgi:hypothetical protein